MLRRKSGDQPVKPSGIQSLTVNGKTDIWPSWYSDKNSGIIKETVAFNKKNGLRAQECTPESQRIELELTKYVDPVSKTETWHVPEGYNYEEMDTCKTVNAEITITRRIVTGTSDNLEIKITAGSSDLVSYRILVDGKESKKGSVTSTVLTNGLTYPVTGTEKNVTVEVTDADGNTVRKSFTSFTNSDVSGGTSSGNN